MLRLTLAGLLALFVLAHPNVSRSSMTLLGTGGASVAAANCILISGTTTNCILISGTTTNALLVK